MDNLHKSRSGSDDNHSKINYPDVIVDFIFDQGLLFISVKNISINPVYRVSVKFDRKLYGINGTKEISALPLFKNIEFMPPQKEITTFMDTSISYFSRKYPTKIAVKISYFDFSGNKYSHTIKHDLEIYREIGYLNLAKEP